MSSIMSMSTADKSGHTQTNYAGCEMKKTPPHKMHYCHSGSELSWQIFRHHSWNSLASAVLVLLHLLRLGPSCRQPTASPGQWIGGRPPDMVASSDLSGWAHLTNKQSRTWRRQSHQTYWLGGRKGIQNVKTWGGCGDGVTVSFCWGGVHRDCWCLPSPLSSPHSTKIQNKQWWRTIKMMG